MDLAVFTSLRFGPDRERIAKEINARGWTCYSDDPGLNVLLDAPQVIDPLVTSTMVAGGSLSENAVLEPVRRADYGVMVMTGLVWTRVDTPNLSKRFIEAVDARYEPAAWPTRYHVFVPRRVRPAG